MVIESILQLLRRSHEYEAYITSKLTMENKCFSEDFFNFDVAPKEKFQS